MDLYLIVFADDTFYQILGIPYGIDLNKLEHSELRYLIDGVEEQEKFHSSIALHQLIMRQKILAPFLHTNEHGNIFTKLCMYFTPVIGHIKGLGLGVGLNAEKDWLKKNATKVVLLKGQSMGTIAGQMYTTMPLSLSASRSPSLPPLLPLTASHSLPLTPSMPLSLSSLFPLSLSSRSPLAQPLRLRASSLCLPLPFSSSPPLPLFP